MNRETDRIQTFVDKMRRLIITRAPLLSETASSSSFVAVVDVVTLSPLFDHV